jgi:hypothetical protein
MKLVQKLGAVILGVASLAFTVNAQAQPAAAGTGSTTQGHGMGQGQHGGMRGHIGIGQHGQTASTQQGGTGGHQHGPLAMGSTGVGCPMTAQHATQHTQR